MEVLMPLYIAELRFYLQYLVPLCVQGKSKQFNLFR